MQPRREARGPGFLLFVEFGSGRETRPIECINPHFGLPTCYQAYSTLSLRVSSNEANQDYARDLSEEMLRRHGRVTANGPRCNLDVITIVAEFVLGDGDLDTLANLNRTCKHIHEGTLPVLYETVRLDDEKAVDSVGVVLPRGWKYTKFLFVTDLTFPLVRLILRYQTEDLTSFSKNLQSIFPRLALVVHRSSRNAERSQRHDDSQPIHLTLFRPLALPVIFTACRPFGRFASNVGISFFGTADPTHSTNRKREKLTKYRDIVGLTVKLGATSRVSKDLFIRKDGASPVWEPDSNSKSRTKRSDPISINYSTAC